MSEAYRKEPKLKIEYAIVCLECGCLIFSRVLHDTRDCVCGMIAIDGGLETRDGRIMGDAGASYQVVTLVLDATEDDLFDDWSDFKDKLGRYTKEEAKELDYQLVGDPQKM